MSAIEKISLFFTQGSSDKEYHAEIVEKDSGNVVNFRYGRRGAALTAGTKTSVPVDFAQAKKIYDKLVKEKTAKGYTPMHSGSEYQNTDAIGIKSDFLPQLLNQITVEEATNLVSDSAWAAQEKMDGERRAAHVENGKVVGMNRKGMIVPLPQTIVDELNSCSKMHGAFRVDGEIIGDLLFVFDLLIHQGLSLQDVSWLERMQLAQRILAECNQVRTVPFSITKTEKQRLWTRVFASHGEGLVFKRVTSRIAPGRPNSGGDWLKFKFIESAACLVTEINTGKRSVKLGLHTDIDTPLPLIPVGNVTIPPNYEIPAVGDIVEVAYLYAYRGGSLYQPVYRGVRVDLDAQACNVQQLKFKPSGSEE